jgi:hypothetical protein
MDHLYDVDLARSVVAFVGGQAAGLALLGRRSERGWIHSVGTLPSWRRFGIARAMVAQVVSTAGEAGVEELSLEVLTEHIPAHRLYESLGFQTRRELHSWHRSGLEPFPGPPERLAPAPPTELCDLIGSWQAQSRAAGERGSRAGDERTCWQLEVESLKRLGGALRGYWLPAVGVGFAPAAGKGPGPLDWSRDAGVGGCCLVSENEQSISIMAARVRPGIDPLICGRRLLQALSARYSSQAMSLSNVPAEGFLCRVLSELCFRVTARQLEMVLYLR